MKLLINAILLLLVINLSANNSNQIIVAKDGTGQFTSISDAIESLPMYCYERVTIFVKNGVYNEKFKIDRDYITLMGESRDSTRIEYELLRQDWIDNKDDIGPAVVNIYADDIIITNLTIENTQPITTEHAFAIYGKGTRTIITNCNVLSNGGDTVSLWDYKTGMYYHDNCYFKGAVDFVCPRGWCYISNSTFYEVRKTAAIWHAAPTNPNQKFVLKNCDFQGADSFYLARHHYDAQFYLLNCTFPEIMRNKPIEHVVYKDKPEKNRPYLHGDRYYFYNCSRTGGDYDWFKTNLNDWPKNITPQNISPQWTFNNQWNPIDSSDIQLQKVDIEADKICLWFNTKVMANNNLVIKTASGKELKYFNGNGRERLEFTGEIDQSDFNNAFHIISGSIQNIDATISPRKVTNSFIKQ